MRDNELASFERQMKLPEPSCISSEVAAAAMQLFRQHYKWVKPIRSLRVRCTDLISMSAPMQLTLFDDKERREKQEALDRAVDEVRRRLGPFAVQRAAVMADGAALRSVTCWFTPTRVGQIESRSTVSLVQMRFTPTRVGQIRCQ